jgi:eukaryotic-like serine/threonine-protein kinase
VNGAEALALVVGVAPGFNLDSGRGCAHNPGGRPVSLAAGSRLGPYEIVSPPGRGGLGEVYRARDRRLGREAAVKVIPEEPAAHKDRLRRFEPEARATAALGHPNILALRRQGAR